MLQPHNTPDQLTILSSPWSCTQDLTSTAHPHAEPPSKCPASPFFCQWFAAPCPCTYPNNYTSGIDRNQTNKQTKNQGAAPHSGAAPHIPFLIPLLLVRMSRPLSITKTDKRRPCRNTISFMIELPTSTCNWLYRTTPPTTARPNYGFPALRWS